ncbi:serine/threonine-protein kinase [Actinomyces naeslundii]|uniref:non-specific serine/threonine protein kinase n=1 Tax=Actinomyces naeslundii TaxID=1655 RepID=A0AA47FG47_ACTNA|nr:serine/threonine-protein kinase [Actinomyces naeslundii]OMG17170.1 kinase [Actinomyces naeslundii]PKY94717.1 serine/threonine protein kinase [Actinomyces naeslundii]WAL42687.1 protein kinase [Actinomyces naeslundii]
MSQSPAPLHLGSSYIMETRIGAGAQGEVWRGRRTDAREVLAFKVLRAELVENPDVVERFIKERSTLLRVRSPYVVAIRDVVIEGSTFAIVMDYVNGGDLRDLLRARGSLPPAQVASLGTRIAQGLSAVHQAGVIHRDIKPANVLLSSRPSRGGDPSETVATGMAPGGNVPEAVVPRLADFGVARICDTFSASHLTGAIGTPLYMAPEILSMQAPTSAADIYSLGIMLYEMTCGTTPFVGEPAQLLGQHARRDAGRPYGVPDALWELIAAMTSKQPDMRPPVEVVAQHLDAMQSTLVGLPAAPRLSSPPQSTASVMPYDWDAPSATDPMAPSAMPPSHSMTPATMAIAPEAPTLVNGQYPHSPGQVPASPGTAGAGGLTVPAAPAVPGGYSSSVPAFYSRPGSQDSAATAARPQAGARRRWWRRRWVAVAAVVTVLAVVGASATWWYFFSGQEIGNRWPAALPAGNSVREDLRYSDVSNPVVSADGTTMAFDHDGKANLVDLTKSTTTPVWSGECYKVRPWGGGSMLCTKTNDASTVIGAEGKTSQAPFSQGAFYIGATQELGIVSDKGEASDGGPMRGYDASGKEKWRASGQYKGGRVDNGFILTYEIKSRQFQVLSAKSGEVLVSEPGAQPDSEFDKDTRFPGGFNIESGPEAFSRVTSSGATIYKANGREAGTVSGKFSEKHWWASSAPLDASSLKDAYSSLAKASSSITPVIGPSGTVDVIVDTSACTAKVGSKKLALPEFSQNEGCHIRPIGLLSDGQALVEVGEYSLSDSDPGNLVVAVSPDTGKVGWKVPGAYGGTVVPVKDQSDARLLVAQGSSYTFDLVVSSITSK